MKYSMVSVVIATLELFGCPPSPTPPPNDADATPPTPIDAPLSDASGPYAACCATLARLGCVEGANGDCAAVVQHVATSQLTPFDVGVCVTATSKVEARKSGALVACP